MELTLTRHFSVILKWLQQQLMCNVGMLRVCVCVCYVVWGEEP